MEVLRTRMVQMEVLPGRPLENAATMLEHVRNARREKIRMLVFPEMAIPGYLLGDEWEREAFLRECETCGEEIRAAAGDLLVVFGNVAVDRRRRNEDGRVRKYNALFVCQDGAFRGPVNGPYPFVIKTLLPNYREFDDSRHFFDLRRLAFEENRSPAELNAPVRAGGLSLGCLICEDAWDRDYGLAPLANLARHGVDLFVNISASPFTTGKNLKRRRVFREHARTYGKPMVYVNHVGLQNNGKTVFVFDGASCLYDAQGGILGAGAAFDDAVLTHDLPLACGAPAAGVPDREDEASLLCRALRYGTARFMALCGVRRVVVGVSGGIDSAVVAALYRSLLDPGDLLLVNMPGPFTSPTTRRLAGQVAANLGALYAEVPIDESVALTKRQMETLRAGVAGGQPDRALAVTETVLENIQARDRSSRVLAAAAAAFGGVFTCNANKAEAAVGYTTLYGDLAGYFANIADLWKGEVYELGRRLNSDVFGREVIPPACFDLAPSAELCSAQDVDAGQGDPFHYPYHDRLFGSWVESWNRTTPEDILQWYAEGALEQRIGYAGSVSDLFPSPADFVADLECWWDRYQGMGVAKRIQAPPILAVKRRAFGFDHREAQMGARYTRRYTELKRRLLSGEAGSFAEPCRGPQS